jgi:hypothetical protein
LAERDFMGDGSVGTDLDFCGFDDFAGFEGFTDFDGFDDFGGLDDFGGFDDCGLGVFPCTCFCAKVDCLGVVGVWGFDIGLPETIRCGVEFPDTILGGVDFPDVGPDGTGLPE